MSDYTLKISTTLPMEKVIGLVASKHTKVRWIREIEKKYTPQTFAVPLERLRADRATTTREHLMRGHGINVYKTGDGFEIEEAT